MGVKMLSAVGAITIIGDTTSSFYLHSYNTLTKKHDSQKKYNKNFKKSKTIRMPLLFATLNAAITYRRHRGKIGRISENEENSWTKLLFNIN